MIMQEYKRSLFAAFVEGEDEGSRVAEVGVGVRVRTATMTNFVLA